MNLDKLNCKNCGAPISLDSDVAECNHCGTLHAIRDRDEVSFGNATPTETDAYPPTPSIRKPQSEHTTIAGVIAAAMALLVILPLFLFIVTSFFNTRRAIQRNFPSTPGRSLESRGDSPRVPDQFPGVPNQIRGIPGRPENVRVEIEGDVPPAIKQQIERTIRDQLR
jgi:hypothetical protein